MPGVPVGSYATNSRGVCTLFASNHPQGLPALRLPPNPRQVWSHPPVHLVDILLDEELGHLYDNGAT